MSFLGGSPFSNPYSSKYLLDACCLLITLLNSLESESCSVMSNSWQPYGLYSPWNSPSRSTGVGRFSFLQRIFPTQGSNPGLPHCEWILYHLSHRGSPRILEWVAYPFSSLSFRPGIKPWFPELQADSSPTEPSVKPS